MKPNLYRVVHSAYVGNSYAGGHQNLTAYVETLDEVEQYRDNLISVTPMKTKDDPEMSMKEVDNYFIKRNEQKAAKQKKEEIKSLKHKLRSLENDKN